MVIPYVTAVSKPGTLKYGFGINMEQEISKDFGVSSPRLYIESGMKK